jgi:prepilin-type N-terminal cleavage/methylation domain-containing protein
MKRRESGFSLLELMISLAIVAFVLTAASTFFIGTVKQYKVQTKITESNVEGILGLELLRQDLESHGYGLPWNNLPSYSEASSGVLNDDGKAPRAVVSVDASTLGINNGSDYLVIKSTRVGMDNAAGKWTTLRAGTPPVTRPWGSAEEDLGTGDRVVVLSPGSSTTDQRVLLTPVEGADFNSLSPYAPPDAFQTNIVYGIGSMATTQFPFNRADYYIGDNSVYPTPRHCAPITGTLVKRVVNHSGGALENPLPLLDCVADMQVVYGLDNNGTGNVTWTPDLAGLFPAGPNAAADIRSKLVEVRVHILAQSGQRDDSYTYPLDNVYVGSEAAGRSFDVSGYRNYRWKQHTIVVKPRNLAN